jgi:ribonuclease HI
LYLFLLLHLVMDAEIITNNTSFDEGSAYGAILLEGEHKDVGYGAGPWEPRHALLPAINMGLGAVDPNSHARVHLPGSQLANYMQAGLVNRWKKNDWKKLNGSPVSPQKEWETLLSLSEMRDVEWIGESDHKLMDWARKCALCAVAQVDVTNLRRTDGLETVSEAKAGQFWMEAKSSGHNDQSARKLLSEFGVVSAKDIPKSEFDAVMERASSPTLVGKYQEMLD